MDWNLVWGSESAWFWTMVQALAVLITLSLILRQLSAQNEQVKTQSYSNMISVISSLNDRWESAEFLRARIEFCRQYLNHDRDIRGRECLMLLHFFEELGIYYRHNVIDMDILWSIYCERVLGYWNLTEDKIREFRAQHKDPTFYEDFEYLRDEIVKHSNKRSVEVRNKTAKEIESFAHSQISNLESDPKLTLLVSKTGQLLKKS